MYPFTAGKPTLIKPINPIVFRWGGEYSPSLTGPMNKGYSEPFPLPSTIAGFLYWIKKGYSTVTEEDELDMEKDYETISKEVELWGPLFYAKGRDAHGKEKVCIAVHEYPKKLRVINEECLSTDRKSTWSLYPVYVNKIGIGHDVAKKQAHTEKGLIYTVEYIDYYATAKKMGLEEVEDYGILVYTNFELKEDFYPFGSEGRVVEVKGVDKLNIKVPESQVFTLSPVILRANESPLDLIISSDTRKIVVDKHDNEEITLNDVADGTLRLSLLGLGFNVKNRVKRPIYLALMPGEVGSTREKFKSLLDKLQEGLAENKLMKLGLFEKIWGSVLIGGGVSG